MLEEIGSKDKIPQFIKEVKTSGGEVRLMGFGHRVYKNYDPRAKIIKVMADRVFEETRHPPRARAYPPRGRVLRQAEALSQRRLLFGADLPGHGIPGGYVPRPLRDP